MKFKEETGFSLEVNPILKSYSKLDNAFKKMLLSDAFSALFSRKWLFILFVKCVKCENLMIKTFKEIFLKLIFDNVLQISSDSIFQSCLLRSTSILNWVYNSSTLNLPSFSNHQRMRNKGAPICRSLHIWPWKCWKSDNMNTDFCSFKARFLQRSRANTRFVYFQFAISHSWLNKKCGFVFSHRFMWIASLSLHKNCTLSFCSFFLAHQYWVVSGCKPSRSPLFTKYNSLRSRSGGTSLRIPGKN